ncbi:MAG: hypothetical protein BWY91_00803 [bacterium ADurb.BinA028]|nr:MAG: hypothetical protein BWY91_00803 [bacterium ADurb.BinA028]
MSPASIVGSSAMPGSARFEPVSFVVTVARPVPTSAFESVAPAPVIGVVNTVLAGFTNSTTYAVCGARSVKA